jgi:IS30 family transposase
MYKFDGEERKCYTPQMSSEAVFALRRLAWCNKKPMTKMVNEIVMEAFKKLSPEQICAQMREHFAIASLQSEEMVSEVPSRGYPPPEECSVMDW